jgi:hypothetical protein
MPKFDAKNVKLACAGRMREILINVGGLNADILDPNREHPCPRCSRDSSDTRFRLIDEQAGAVRCSHCFANDCGDIFAAIGFCKGIDHRGKDFPKIVALIAEYLRLQPTADPKLSDQTKAKTEQPADEVTRDRVYRVLLENMPLAPEHLDKMLARKFSQEAIERNQYRSWRREGNDWKAIRAAVAAAGKDRYRIPGLSFKHGLLTRGDGMIVPVRNEQGLIIALQNRLDDPAADPKYVYVASKRCSAGAPGHVPLGITLPCELVRLTEGIIKSDLAYHLSGLPTITGGGVNWKQIVPVLKRLGARTVLLAFDADAGDNKHVSGAALRAFEGLAQAGFDMKLEAWPLADGKGIDDLLANGKTAEVLDGFWAIEKLQENAAAAEKAEAQDKHAQTVDLVNRIKSKMKEGAESFFADAELLGHMAELQRDDALAFATLRASAKANKIPLRDLDKALKQLGDAQKAKKAAQGQFDDEHGYCVVNDALCMLEPVEGEDVPVELCNFTARIVDETTRDDGAESKIFFGINGKLQQGRELPRIEIAAGSFLDGEWICSAWGSDAIVWKSRFRVTTGIQAISKEKVKQTVYTHTGWREVGDRWAYLHAGGSIGLGPNDNPLSVEIRPPLGNYLLPDPKSTDVKQSIAACLKFLDLTHHRITYPLLAAVFRSIIGDTDFSVFLVGTSGVFKSEIAACCQQFFGAKLDSRHLPGSWSSTENALEQTAFLAKDAVFVIDDFAPNGGPGEVAKLQAKAERIFRAQGNHSGRNRMNADGSLRPPKPPRCMVMATGEEVPWGQSLRARLLVIGVEKDDIKSDKLTICQGEAAAGLYASAASAFIAWMAPSYAKVKENWANKVAEARKKAAGSHARTPVTVAELDVAFRFFLQFAERAGAIDEATRMEYRDNCWNALNEAAGEQAAQQAVSEPAQHFMRLLPSLISAGRAHLADMNGSNPEFNSRWGWERKDIRTSTGVDTTWQPRGPRIGWTDGCYVYLEFEPAFAAVQAMAREQGQIITIAPATMKRRLKEAGFVEASDDARKIIERRVTCEGDYGPRLWLGIQHFGNLQESTLPD